MSKLKIIDSIKSKFINKELYDENDSDIVKYLKTAAGPKMTSIAVIVISKNTFTMVQDRFGKHNQLVGSLIPIEEQESIKEKLVNMDLTQAAPKYLGYVVIEMVGPVNGGYSAIYYPDNINDYQIKKLEYFNEELNKYNETCENELLKAKVLTSDPETNRGSDNLTDVLDKLKSLNRTR